MADPKKIENAIRRVRNRKSFIRELLIDALGWDIDERAEEVEDITFEWSAKELRAYDLDKHIVDGTIRQIRPFNDNPWGIFILEFKNPDVFATGRGMTGTLGNVLRGLVAAKKKRSSLASFRKENLLFLCNHDYKHYRFAHFKTPCGAGVPPARNAAGTAAPQSIAPLAVFGWGPGDPVRSLCEYNLNALKWPDGQPDPEGWVAAWSQAFDVEKVTQRFYEDYAAVFDKVEKLIGRQKELKGDDLRMFTQTLFNRLMFLRFMERKGWLTFGGCKDYLRALYAAGGFAKNSFYKGRLCPLFFEGLAIEGKQRSDAYGCVPYLNGGLFERSERDKQVSDLPDEVFAGILADEHAGGLFYRYNFTVEESTPLDIEVAIDPEMLGKVFEELVTGRHESGSYYTPRPVVSFMCREALKGYLSAKLTCGAAVPPARNVAGTAAGNAAGTAAPQGIPEAIAALMDCRDASGLEETHAREILAALDDVKAVDPACGSGAYLLGLLQEMIVLYRLLYSEKLVKDARTLYDLKLRIISRSLYGVDIDPFATNIAKLRLWLSLAVEADKPVPLPNLDFKIETGDSLLAPDPQEMPDPFRGLLQASADVLATAKNRFFLAHGAEKEEHRSAILSQESHLRNESTAEHGDGVLDWRIRFAEAFVNKRGGFDIVLANPPYIDSERMTKTDAKVRKQIQKSYRFTQGNWDIYIAFFELGFRLLNRRGVLTFITPDKWISKPFGDALRLATADKIVCILNAGRSVFEKAKVDAIVSVFTKQRCPLLQIRDFAESEIRLKRVVAKDSLTSPYAYDWLFSDFVELLTKIAANPGRLSKFAECENACATSDAYKLQEYVEEDARRHGDYLRIVNTGTIGRYVSKWGQREMVYLGSRFSRPVVNRARFLKAFQNSYGKKAVRPKLIVKGLNLLDACLDEQGCIIPGKTTLTVCSDSLDNLKGLLCIVNSSLAFFYLKEKYPASSYNQGTTFSKEMINGLPIPQLSRNDWRRLISCADKIIRMKQANPSADTAAAAEKEVDRLVYQFYGLTSDEVTVVERNAR
ncbi:MAG: Eco57I restriction-modification methylase domain-containing protein [Thermoguttaceae bacterium]